MTDTGQVPAEGLPENAGMVEQPGVPAHGAYTYLSETTAEDEDLLLLPGAQGAWGNEVPPPAPEPVVETVHEPGPHETAGRDSGSVDLGGVRLPEPPPAPVTPRRPLHLGPPLPDTSASPVRSLADRGPAGAPVRQPGPPATGTEYLDAPQLRDLPPQGASPWGAQAPVGVAAQTAETVAPLPEPAPESAGAAQATEPAGGSVATAAPDAGVVTPEPVPVPVPVPAVVPDMGMAQAPDAGQAWQGHGQSFMGEPATAFAHVSTESSGHAGVPETGQLAAQAEVSAAGQGSAAAFAPGGDGHGVDAGYAPEDGGAAEAAGASAAVPVSEDAFAAGTGSTGSGPVDAFAVDGVQVQDAAVVSDVAQAPASVDDSAAEPASEEAFASEVEPRPETEEVYDAGFAAGNEHGAETGTVHDAGQAPEDVVTPEPEPAPTQDVAFAPEVTEAYETVTEAETEVAPVDATGVIAQEAEPTPAAPAVVEAPLTPEAASPTPQTAPEPEPVHAEIAAAPVEDVTYPTQFAEAEAEAVAAPVLEAEPVPAPQPVVLEDTAGTGPAEPLLPTAPQAQSVALEDTPLAQPPTPDAQFPEPPQALPLPPEPQPDDSLGRFVAVEGSVPTTPHLAPTPPHPLTLPAEELPGADVGEELFATVPAPREADADPELVQHADDLDTRAADQEEESTAAVEDVRESTGPAAPPYDDAEREAVLKVMRERRDIRNGFRSDPIPHDVLLRVLEAAHTAPSVGHSQPWDFVVIRSADTRRNMHELAQSQREAYAKSLPKGRAKQFKELKIEAILDTPVNIVVTADPTRGGRHTLGRHTQPQMAPYSAALAVENLWLAARAEGLGVGWVSFFDEREMVRALGLPEHLEVIAYLCVGYVDEFPDEPELMQAGWSKRRPLSWVVHEETYGRRALPGEDPHDLLAETVAGIRPLDAKALGEAWERQKRMTKPPGSLGMLEIISAQLSGLSRQCPPPIPEPAAVAIFAGDHGVHAQGVTPWPQEVTAQMVANFLGGGAVCNAFASQVGAEVCVVDVGVASELPATPGLLPRKIRAGTSDMTTGPAMTREEAKQAIEVGIETARDLVAAGNKALLTGEMGIANTTASAALISVFTDTDPAEVTGRGTGINDETLARKTEVVRRAIELHQPDPADPIGVLAAVGGFEHAAMVGLLLGGASLRTPVILDGVSAGAAALVARAIAPEVLAACIAGHRSAEPGHVAALNKLGLRPLVDLDLRLGEGTGALLALPLVQSTARAMHEVATFDSAGVTEK
ncbi:nicotinate-nucleotide--dimethylbenzimidazole phosphoribosyltransferase [Streptomyces xylophagus]|uniref:nicotinate-nucleotide--dimethylbenzimidazole phosphoribosyltransferase n=1 Tax=Streptomyces xylophagus TaxID=285514 RepID=UPI0005BAB657|nr:nicotinate-nucleotide--dimethylbenzimidazole phosphoribosyltransferase [Streptomyces xylophagus]